MTAMTSSLCVLGSANMDLVVTAASAAEAGETVFGTSFALSPGGKGLNQAVAAARAGGAVCFIGTVGIDEFGSRIVGMLEEEGIDITRVARVDVPTGTAHIVVTDDGENRIVVIAGANADTTLDDAARRAITASSVLSAQLERPGALVEEAFRFARSRGVTTVLTPAPVTEGAARLVELSDVVIPNAGEARALTGLESVMEAAERLSRGRTSVVTCGADGALVARDGVLLAQIAAPRVARVVDTTGAGDTLAGVVAARLAAGDDIVHAARSGVVAASLSVRRPGAAPSMPTADEIDHAMRIPAETVSL